MERATPDSGITYRVASRTDEPIVRDLLARIATGGHMSLSFRREPDAFGASFGARAQDFILAHDPRRGEYVGLCERVVRNCFVNGEIRALPYLAGLRVAPEYRHRLRVVRGGFEAVRRLLGAPGDLPWSLTSIMADNETARRVLGAGLPGMPRYEPMGEFSTFAFPASGRATCETARDPDLSEIVSLLRANGARQQFASAWSLETLREVMAASGLKPEDFFVIRDDGRIRACAALWDQSAQRQVVVAGYSKWLARGRLLINLGARLATLPRLPAPGRQLRCAYLSHVAVLEGASGDLVKLIAAARARAHERGLDVLLTGWETQGPNARCIRLLPRGREYRSILYRVRWPEDPAPDMDPRLPVAPELALL